MSFPHTPVLLQEVLQFFRQKTLRIFIDATLGAGSHSEAILKEHPEIELLIGIDQDPVARCIAQERLSSWKDKIRIIPVNFSQLGKELDLIGAGLADGIIFDLGVSSMQFDIAEKGFSFMRDGPLDMRMDPSQSLTAAEIVNEWSEEKIFHIFREYGEEKRAWKAACAIRDSRKQKSIQTTFELADVLKDVLRPHPFKKGIHPLTLVFQALRIAVNNELEVLETVLPVAIERLARGGRLGVISFHSLEDRIVKNALRFAASDKMNTSGIGGLFLDKDPQITILTKKPLIATNEEVKKNPRSRSAKLRLVEKR